MPAEAQMRTAANRLRAGGLVALPTETVYGLAADAGNADAVAAIFAAKGRPATNPLIVHVANADAARRVAGGWPEVADALAAAFWPGPLTLVLPTGRGLADAVTAGGDTVGLRVPNHPLTLDVLGRFHALGGIGVAMPSANRSEHVSPTTAAHVRDDLGDRVDLILDGGPCGVGIESTVVRLTGPAPVVLRPGAVSVEQLRAVLGDVAIRGGSDAGVAQSPGRQPRHYAPDLAVRVAEESDGGEADAVLARVSVRANATALPNDPAEYGRALYSVLRRLEADPAVRSLLILLPPDEPRWTAIRDRLGRMGERKRSQSGCS